MKINKKNPITLNIYVAYEQFFIWDKKIKFSLKLKCKENGNICIK